MTTFIVNDKDFFCENTLSLLDVKKKIIKEYQIKSPYIDISFELETPIRILGKFNVEPGLVPRSLDRYTLDKFAFKGKIKLSITEITDYNPDIIKRKFVSGGGRGRGIDKRQESMFDHNSNEISMNEPSFDLTSNTDFPVIGS